MKEHVVYEIKTLSNLIDRDLMITHKNMFNNLVTPTQLQIIKYILNHEETFQSDLEKYLKVRRSTISGILKTMERNNIIKKIKSENDDRINKIELTDICKDKITKVKKDALNYEEKLTFNISEQELKIFLNVIEKIKQNINE